MNSFEHCAIVGLTRCGTYAERYAGCSGIACKLARKIDDKARRLRKYEREKSA